MKRLAFISVLLTLRETLSIHDGLPEETQNKTKRGLAEQTRVFGELPFQPISVYTDNIAAPTQPGLTNYYAPKYPSFPNVKLYDNNAEPKLLFRYQPVNTVINNDANEQFQAIPAQNNEIRPASSQQILYMNYPSQISRQTLHQSPTNQFPLTAETVITPVKHSTYIQHIPYVQHQIQQQVNPYLLGKHVLANGKYSYYPEPVANPYYPHQLQPQNQQQHKQSFHPLNHPQQPEPQQHQRLQQSQRPQHPQRPQQLKQHQNKQQFHDVYKPLPQILTPPRLIAPMSFQNYNQAENRVPNIEVVEKERRNEDEKEPRNEDEKEQRNEDENERRNKHDKEEESNNDREENKEENKEEIDEEENEGDKEEVRNESEDDEDERSNNRNEEDEDDESHEGYSLNDDEDEDEESDKYRHEPDEDSDQYRHEFNGDSNKNRQDPDEESNKNRHDTDEESDNYRQDAEAEDEESDEDSNREQTEHRKPTNYKKSEQKPKYKKSSSNNYKVKEGYESNVKYSKSKPSKDSKMIYHKPKKVYQAYSFTKTNDGKPKIEMIHGKHSHIVPVAIQQVYREKWFITRNNE